jgi:hypothetical protein
MAKPCHVPPLLIELSMCRSASLTYGLARNSHPLPSLLGDRSLVLVPPEPGRVPQLESYWGTGFSSWSRPRLGGQVFRSPPPLPPDPIATPVRGVRPEHLTGGQAFRHPHPRLLGDGSLVWGRLNLAGQGPPQGDRLLVTPPGEELSPPVRATGGQVFGLGPSRAGPGTPTGELLGDRLFLVVPPAPRGTGLS